MVPLEPLLNMKAGDPRVTPLLHLGKEGSLLKMENSFETYSAAKIKKPSKDLSPQENDCNARPPQMPCKLYTLHLFLLIFTCHPS